MAPRGSERAQRTWSSARARRAAAHTRPPAALVPTTTIDGTEEKKNYANLGYTAGTTYYVDDSISDASGLATHFDDIVSRPALLTVINKAALGPRSH